LNANSAARTLSVQKAHETQLQLSKRIAFEDRLPPNIHLVAGVDVAYAQNVSIGAVAVLNYNSLELVESQTATCETRFPYIPTLLSFREIPPAVLSIRKLRRLPDLFLVDGQGYAHPYHCGFASHLGLIINRPTIGVAKSRLVGSIESKEKKQRISLLEYKKEVIGASVTTKAWDKPIYVSVGHMVSLKKAIAIVKHCTPSSRVPEPILRAHDIANLEKRKVNNG
jgi:deoxyribonuclease V